MHSTSLKADEVIYILIIAIKRLTAPTTAYTVLQPAMASILSLLPSFRIKSYCAEFNLFKSYVYHTFQNKVLQLLMLLSISVINRSLSPGRPLVVLLIEI